MAGIYVHIPFCKSRCRYCDFYSTTMLGRQSEYISALKQELQLRASCFEQEFRMRGENLKTVYFGGGTPSTLCEKDIADFLMAIRNCFPTETIDEITLEANPGDLTEEKLLFLRKAGVNRLSIGIQSFNDALLHLIGRRHSSEEAIEAVRMAKRCGFDNISIDMMYGLPEQSLDDWKRDVQVAVSLDVQHVSAYCLTYEEGTPLYKALLKGEVEELDEDLLNEMQEYLEDVLQQSGIIRYEISNYAIPGYESKHNSSYWIGSPYLGLGAGAHSYDGKYHRKWNPDDIISYISGLEAGRLQLQCEELTDVDLYNERIMLGLRTTAGIDISHFSHDEQVGLIDRLDKFLSEGLLVADGSRVRANRMGMRILNSIITELMDD